TLLPAATVTAPLPWLVNRSNVAGLADPAATVSPPPLVKLTNDPGPVTDMTALPAVVAPLRAVPPVTVNVPVPRRNPPLTAAPLSVSVTPAGACSEPPVRLNVRAVVAVAVYRSVPA